MRSEAVNKRGILSLLRDPTSNQWRKYWFVLRRPYLFVYSSNSEVDEAAVINVSTVRVEQSPEIEQMLEVRPASSCSPFLPLCRHSPPPSAFPAAQACFRHLYPSKQVRRFPLPALDPPAPR